MRFFSISLALALSLVISTALAQSPGPNWPGCTRTSTTHHPGWEVLNLRYQPPESGSMVASADIDLQNAADGSRTICHLSSNVTDVDTQENLRLLSKRDGNCFTAWAEKYYYDVQGPGEQPQAQVEIDVWTGALSIEQTWSCDDAEAIEGIRYTAKAALGFEPECSRGREGEPTACTPAGLFQIGEPLLSVGPAVVKGESASDNLTISFQIDKQEDCTTTPSDLRGWQILQMSYWPAAEQPEGSPYEPVSLRIELRNLNDQSRTICYLGSDDFRGAEDEGISLGNNGTELGDGNYENGCVTGRFDLVGSEDGEVSQAWRWGRTANVTFDTKSFDLGISQFWECGGVEDAFFGSAAGRLEMVCEDTGNSMVPTVCEPKDALYSESGSLALVGDVEYA
ncbi:uncharacterized protein DNG_10123 [Cephalotrichum gorgonifer]|uniref:Uncharacterized protein n=1 Tax=Cephalotrichum gorgonifer TaxID=2041049 RepID=A0AAE8N8A5_9PEZI|nr:uncharacterized protein DNG_10123 [Cephalotrichum gorgonifer]